MKIEFSTEYENDILTPIAVASALINHITYYEVNNSIPKIFQITERKTFCVEELHEIAEHLIVYCNHIKEPMPITLMERKNDGE